MKIINKCAQIFCTSLLFAVSYAHAAPANITRDMVAGFYQFSVSSSSSITPATDAPQTIAAVGQLVFQPDGTGALLAHDEALIINGSYTFVQHPAVFTYCVGAECPTPNPNGMGEITILESDGSTLSGKLAFKMHKGVITGFSSISSSSNPPTVLQSLPAFLIQGERFD